MADGFEECSEVSEIIRIECQICSGRTLPNTRDREIKLDKIWGPKGPKARYDL